MSQHRALEAEARKFAEGLTRTVQAVVGEDCPPFRIDARRDHLAIAQVPAEGIVLCRSGDPLIRLEVEFACVWDRSGRYLKVLKSDIALYPADPAATQPYFRYEYEPKGTRNLPDAHLHIHDDPGAPSRLTQLMPQAGGGTRRSRKRQGSLKAARSDLHFPLGGDRFRPTLEDVLHVLIEEFGVDKQDGWRAVLENARESWRLRQTAVVTRDAPEVAARALEELGYVVTPPQAGHPPLQSARLRSL